MALSQVPTTPIWNQSNGCAATPDGGVLYIGMRSVTYIGAYDAPGTPVVKAFQMRQPVRSIDVDPSWPATAPSEQDDDDEKVQRFFVILADDDSVQVWDFNKGRAVRGHKAHSKHRYVEGNGPSSHHSRVMDPLLMACMCNRNVLSVDSHDMVIYCVASNTYCQRPMIGQSRGQHMTALSCSPYNENIFAVGNTRGLVQVFDIQRMVVLYTLRGHDAAITSLSWMRVDGCGADEVYAVEATAVAEPPKPAAKAKPLKQQAAIAAACDDVFDIYDYDYLENEFGVPASNGGGSKEGRPIRKSDSDENDFVGVEKPKESGGSNQFNYAEACQSLREDIATLRSSDKDQDQETAECNEVTLADCQKAKRYDSTSDEDADDAKAKAKDECDSNASTEGSLELINHSSSSDGVDVDGAERKPKRQVLLHQAEVHACQSLEKAKVDVKEVEAAAEEPKTDEDQKEKVEEKKEKAAGDASGADILLASSATDGSIWIWDTEKGAPYDNVKVRNNPKLPKSNLPVDVRWLSPRSFLVSTKSGDLYQFVGTSDPKQEASKRRYKFKEHSVIFAQRSIAGYGLNTGKLLLWCVTCNREVFCHDIQSKRMVANYSCASTNVHIMRECPDDMNKIALGMNDRRLAIIDTSQLTSTNVHMENFSSRIDASVVSLAWSPDCRRLAFATQEGRVGIVNVENAKQQCYLFNPVCGKTIYSIAWEEDRIYIVVNNIVAVYDTNSNSKDAVIIRDCKAASQVMVRNDIMFVGTQCGSLQVFRRSGSKFTLLQEVKITTRYITDASWNPLDASRFAMVANSNRITVLSFDATTAVVSPLNVVDSPNDKFGIPCVKWSNRNKDEFLTCGFDGTVRVWQLTDGAIVQTFVKQFNCPLNTAMFLPSNEDVLVCSGRTISLEFMNRKEPPQDEGAEAVKRNKSSRQVQDNIQWATKMPSRSDGKEAAGTEKRSKRAERRADKKKRASTERINQGEGEVAGGDKENVDISNMIDGLHISGGGENVSKDSEVFMKNPPTLLCLTTKELNKDPISKLTWILEAPQWNGKKGDKKVLVSKLFAQKQYVKDLLGQELQNHIKSDSKGISSIVLHQMTNSLKEEILKCIQAKKLTEWHVSMAPSISYIFWQKCCQAFADQLMEQGCALQASSYLIAIHNEIDAIKMLMKSNYHKEALLLARLYLEDDDEFISQIADEWIRQVESIGNFSGAALLCVMNNQYGRAYDILVRQRSQTPQTESVLAMLQAKSSKQADE